MDLDEGWFVVPQAEHEIQPIRSKQANTKTILQQHALLTLLKYTKQQLRIERWCWGTAVLILLFLLHRKR